MIRNTLLIPQGETDCHHTHRKQCRAIGKCNVTVLVVIWCIVFKIRCQNNDKNSCFSCSETLGACLLCCLNVKQHYDFKKQPDIFQICSQISWMHHRGPSQEEWRKVVTRVLLQLGLKAAPGSCPARKIRHMKWPSNWKPETAVPHPIETPDVVD